MNPNLLTIETLDLESSIDFYSNKLNYHIDQRYRIGKSSEIAILRDDKDILELVLSDHNRVECNGSINKVVQSITDLVKNCKNDVFEILHFDQSKNDDFKMMTIIDKHGVTINLYEKKKH